MTRKFHPSPLALAVLTLLHEAPMHPYKMQRLIKERGKDQVIQVKQRASLYQVISQLQRAGLIALWETNRQEGFPERTLYRLTDEGHRTALIWMRAMLSTPVQEFPQFPAAISLLPLLAPADALQQLETRQARLIEQVAAIDEEVRIHAAGLPRLFLLESEYRRAVLEAEMKWVGSVITDLRGGQLDWTDTWMRPDVPPESAE